jgi:hypothetical protein
MSPRAVLGRCDKRAGSAERRKVRRSRYRAWHRHLAAGRTLRIAAGAARVSLRYFSRRVRRPLTSRKHEAELDRRYHEKTARVALESMGHRKGALMNSILSRLGACENWRAPSLRYSFGERSASEASAAEA